MTRSKDDIDWTELVRVPEDYLDFEVSLLHDMLCAIRSIEHVNDELYFDDFDHKYIGELDVEDFFKYDEGMHRWLELTPESTIYDFKSFRGYRWMTEAAQWIKDGIPPVIVISYEDICQIGDGRGRLNVANMIQHKVPTYLMRYDNAS